MRARRNLLVAFTCLCCVTAVVAGERDRSGKRSARTERPTVLARHVEPQPQFVPAGGAPATDCEKGCADKAEDIFEKCLADGGTEEE